MNTSLVAHRWPGSAAYLAQTQHEARDTGEPPATGGDPRSAREPEVATDEAEFEESTTLHDASDS